MGFLHPGIKPEYYPRDSPPLLNSSMRDVLDLLEDRITAARNEITMHHEHIEHLEPLLDDHRLSIEIAEAEIVRLQAAVEVFYSLPGYLG